MGLAIQIATTGHNLDTSYISDIEEREAEPDAGEDPRPGRRPRRRPRRADEGPQARQAAVGAGRDFDFTGVNVDLRVMSTITADSATDIAVRALRDERAIHLREAHRIGTLLRLIGDEVAPPERPSVRRRVRDLLREDADRTWSVSELMAELQAIEPLPGTNPERECAVPCATCGPKGSSCGRSVAGIRPTSGRQSPCSAQPRGKAPVRPGAFNRCPYRIEDSERTSADGHPTASARLRPGSSAPALRVPAPSHDTLEPALMKVFRQVGGPGSLSHPLRTIGGRTDRKLSGRGGGCTPPGQDQEP
jgi:hypothetical protein